MTVPRIMKAILGLVVAGSCLAGVKADSPTVDLSLVAPWSAPNLLVEIAETIATHNETQYFNLLQDFISIEEKASSLTDYKLYNEAVKVISSLGVDETNFFKIALSVHEAAPRIEAYNQYYRESVIPSLSQYDDQCEVWAQVDNTQVCDFQEFVNSIKQESEASINLLPFDHIIRPSSGVSRKTVILYTTQFSSKFAEFHNYLTKAVDEQEITYVIRYRSPLSSLAPGTPLYLSGYGVEMALKNTDYLVIDDRTSEDIKTKDSIKDKLSGFGKKISQSLFHADQKATIDPLTPAEIKSLGLKAAQYVARSSNPLETLTKLSQDFPKYAKSVSEVELDAEFEQESINNQMSFLRSGLNAVWLNGKGLDYSQVDPFYLVRALRTERKLIQSMQDIGFTSKEAIQIISSPVLTKASRFSEQAADEVYDVRDTAEEPFTVWWNDIEKDSRYKTWSSDVHEYLKPTYPGQLHPVKKNSFNLLMIEDLSQPGSLARMVQEVQGIIKRGIPLRFGTAFIIKDEHSTSTIIAKTLHYLIEEYGKSQGMNFLTQILETTGEEGLKEPTMDIVQEAFTDAIARSGKSKSRVNRNFKEALATQDTFAKSTLDFLQRMGITEIKSDNGIMFLNGKLLEFNEAKPWVSVVMPSLNEQIRTIQKLVYNNQFQDDLVFYDYILTRPNVVRNRNSYIVPSNTHPLRMLEFNNVQGSNELKYFQSDKDIAPTVNLWISSDFNSHSGLQLAWEALSFIESNPKVRIAFAHNPSTQSKEIAATVMDENNEPNFSDLLYNVIYTQNTDISELKYLFMQAIASLTDKKVSTDGTSKMITPGSPIIELVATENGKKWAELANKFEKDGVAQPFSGIVINGRVIGPLPEDTLFTKDNFDSLYQLEYTRRISPIEEVIFESEHEFSKETDKSNVLSKVSVLIENDKSDVARSVTEDREPMNRIRIYQNIEETKHTRIVAGDIKNTFLEIGVILDPLSETAQKWTPVLQALSEIDGVSVLVYLNPDPNLKELPLKRFYRYVFDKELRFDKVTGDQIVPTAYFQDLPVKPLYTLGVETTNAWHVTVREANMDLDNILLTSLKKSQSGVSAVYELERILVEGHCLDSVTKAPPRGLQFEISSPSKSTKKDTLVMANLGYFQLKALPGVWNLGLREGRSSEVYSIEDIGTEGEWNWDITDPNKKDNSVLALTSFEGLTVTPLVRKKPGMESEDVLESADDKKADDESGLWSSLSSKLFGKKNEADETALLAQPKQAEINIFSVASGKLYERFLSIMMASVMNHTESTVKFWFIENFLSPEFKDFVPYMAEQYGFDYEMVTYKWPAWLRGQREKQRTIWGYKILFLDVLFPLSLDKVIFVDADQIVRADLKELIDMDLQGAPYGYTPFCSDRTEMDGFRFWSEGYWKSHLRGKPYHISALYVVDLVRFRQLAAGDRLRAQYQQLSADPNSLANLDQDLPNNMQHMVPIFSLPQEWLWCETWCSDESLKTAKTIDLCNNPLTKEPKLDRARRQIPEWESYDAEIDHLRKQVASGYTKPIVINHDQIVISADTPDTEKHIKDEL
ncbi:UDP-glucose:glycoprotein glucosyltransferase-domain-containing protein [Helicostylum pulchrum]|nr:UDP-glucose:glycoprotein glucosyltransferase-domain-containing protein [Helicostylum pulchrum]